MWTVTTTMDGQTNQTFPLAHACGVIRAVRAHVQWLYKNRLRHTCTIWGDYNLIGQLEVHCFTYGPPERSYK